MIALNIEEDPTLVIEEALAEAEVDKDRALSLLALSDADEAKLITKAYKSLVPVERAAIGLDHLRVSCDVSAAKVLGLITEQMFLKASSVTGMILASKSPDVMRSAIAFSASKEGHQDRKMLLQQGGNAPVPKTQNTFISVKNSQIGGTINNNKIPTFEDIMQGVDDDFDSAPILEARVTYEE